MQFIVSVYPLVQGSTSRNADTPEIKHKSLYAKTSNIYDLASYYKY
jgi:hypothetical protein